jgi:hypothetical protein
MIHQARRRPAVFIAVALGVLLTVPRPAPASDGTHKGTVKGFTASTLVLKLGVQEREVAFHVGPATRVTINGRQATLSDLKQGDSARVTAKQADGGGLHAKKVEAKRDKMPDPQAG